MTRSKQLGLLSVMAIANVLNLDGGPLSVGGGQNEIPRHLNPVKRKSSRELRSADDIDDRYKKQEAKLARRAARANGGAK